MFDPAVFAYKSAVKGTLIGDWGTFGGNEAGSGVVRVGAFRGSGTLIPISASGSLAVVKLQVKCVSLTEGTTRSLRIENYTDGLAGFTPKPAYTTFTYRACPALGDVNGDGSRTPGDAQRAFDIYLGRITPTDCERATSDANCDTATTPGDAQKIFDHYLGRYVLAQCCAEYVPTAPAQGAIPSTLGFSSQHQPQRRTVSVLDGVGIGGESLVLPVMVSSPNGLQAFSFELLYQPEYLEFIGTTSTALTEGFEIRSSSMMPGLVRIEGNGAPLLSGESEEAPLICAVFTVHRNITGDSMVLISNPGGDLTFAGTRSSRVVVERPIITRNRTVSVGAPRVELDGTWSIPVVVNDAFGMNSFGAEFIYDIRHLQFWGARNGALTYDFASVDANEVEPGKIRFGGYGTSAISRKGQGTLIELRFLPLTGMLGRIEVFNLVDGLAGYKIIR